MKKDTNVENGSQVLPTKSPESADSLSQHVIRNSVDDQFDIPSALIAWLARINQRYLSENLSETLLE